MAAPVIDSTEVLLDALETSGAGGLADNNTQVTGSASIITSYDADAASGAGYGWLPTNAGVRSNGGNTADNQMQGTILGSANEFTAVDGSSAAGRGKRLFYTHIYSSQGSALNNWNNVGSTGYGGIFWLLSDQDPDGTANTDRTANCRGWCVGGRDTIPTLFAPTPTSFICADAEHTASEVETGAGTELTHITVDSTPDRFDPENIVCAAWGWKLTGGGFIGTVSRFGYYDAYTAYEGDALQPGRFQLFYDTTQSEQHYGVAKGDAAQFRMRLAVEFGTAARTGFPGGQTGPTYFEDSNISVEFSESMQNLQTPLVRVFHAGFNKIGMESFLRSGDTVNMINIQFTGATPWHFRFDSTAGATVLFDNCIIQNAGGTDDDAEIGSDVTISGGLIDVCGKLSINGGTIEQLAVTNPASTAAVDITESSTITEVDFSTTDPNKYAIEIPDPGGTTDSYTIDASTYLGFDFDVRVLGTTGTVNIAITNNGDTPTISKGTETTETPTLLGAGWVDGSSYTAVAGGGDDLRAVFVVVSNNGSKVPTGTTFGGEDMELIEQNLQDEIGLSLYYIRETAASSVFTGSQTIAASYTGGDPGSITYQAATYDHINQANQVVGGVPGFLTNEDSNSTGGAGGTVLNLDDWVSTNEVNSVTLSPSSGSQRLAILIVNHEDNGGSPGVTSATYRGQTMTEITGGATAGNNSSQMFYLNEAGIAAGSGSTATTAGSVGDTPSLGIAIFSNVDQTTPIRDSGTATGSNPNVTGLDIDNGDMVVGSFASTGGSNSSANTGELTPADSSFAQNTADDPSEGAYKAYSSADTTTGQAGWTGGDATRTCTVVAVLAGGSADAGNLATTLSQVEDEGLVISAAQTNSTTPFGITFGGDVTERDEVSSGDRRVAVADYVESTGPADVDATMTDTSSTVGADAQLITAAIRPAKTTSGGPTVNVTNNVNVVVDGLTEGTSVKIIASATVGSVTSGDVLAEGFADSNGAFAYLHNYEGDLSVLIRARNQGIAVAAIAEDGGVFTDETEEANSEATNDMNLLPASPAVNDAYYFGHNEQFTRLKIDVSDANGTGSTIVWEYWDGTSWDPLTGVSDGTSNFETAGKNIVSWTLPGDWATNTVNSQGPLYYVRARLSVLGSANQTRARKCTLDTTRYLPFVQPNTIVQTGLTVRAVWTRDTIAKFDPSD